MYELVSPKIYYVYDEHETLIHQYESEDVSENYINPDEVKSAIDNLKTVLEDGFTNIGNKIADEAAYDAENALVVEDTNTSSLFDEVSGMLTDGTIMTELNTTLDSMYESAVAKHNELQEAANLQTSEIANSSYGKSRVAVVDKYSSNSL